MGLMSITPKDLEMIAATTVGHYERGAHDYWADTRDHDVSQNVAALLDHIEGPPPLALLDFGCGPGRDLKTFKDLGHHPIGLDGAKQFVAMAREYAGCEVWHQDFLRLSLPRETFDGIFANAVLFHVPSQELPRVLVEMRMALKPGGVLFSSNPRGDGQEGWRGDRYGAFHDLPTWRTFMRAAGFLELEHFYRPAGLPIEQRPWLATVWRNPST